MIKVSKFLTASSNTVEISSDRIDLLFDPFKGFLQVGIGGEWWNGKVDMGKTTLHHKKEKIDEAYKPVTVWIREYGHGLSFNIMGGFLDSGETFALDFTKASH